MEQGGEIISYLPGVTHPQPKQWSMCAQSNMRDVNNNKICFPEFSGASKGLGSGIFSGLFLLPRTRAETKEHQLLPGAVDTKVAPRK